MLVYVYIIHIVHYAMLCKKVIIFIIIHSSADESLCERDTFNYNYGEKKIIMCRNEAERQKEIIVNVNHALFRRVVLNGWISTLAL